MDYKSKKSGYWKDSGVWGKIMKDSIEKIGIGNDSNDFDWLNEAERKPDWGVSTGLIKGLSEPSKNFEMPISLSDRWGEVVKSNTEMIKDQKEMDKVIKKLNKEKKLKKAKENYDSNYDKLIEVIE